MRQSVISRNIGAFLVAVLCLAGCYEVELPVSAPQIVVEGWIEDGGFPVVMLTTTVPINENVTDVDDLSRFVINWGKVTITYGRDSVVLTGKKDDNYFPPYIYTTTSFTGKAGGTYKIIVEYSGRTVTAETTIPAPKPLEYLKVTRSREEADKFYLVGGVKDNDASKDYYKFFIMIAGKDRSYISSFMGLTDDATLDGKENAEGIAELPINNGSRSSEDKMFPSFGAKDKVKVRFSTLDRTSWEYWNDFEEVQSLSRNPFFPSSTSIRSNIKGGLGYWAGYGSCTYHVSIPDSLKAGRVY